MAKFRRRFSEWTSTAKTWPLSATFMAILVSLAFLVWAKEGLELKSVIEKVAIQINWLYVLVGLPLLCFAMTGIIYKLLFPGFRRNNVTNLLVHLIWTSIVAAATSFIATKDFYWEILIAVAPVGLIASGITHGKNKMAAYSYAFEIMASFIYVTTWTFIGLFPMTTIMVFLTIPIAVGCSKTIINSIEGGAHLTKDLGARTANLLHLFSILLALAFIGAMLLKQTAA